LVHRVSRLVRVILAALLAVSLMAAGNASADTPVLRLGTTTSTDNSGLLDVLLPEFRQSHGYNVHVIAAGTGKVLKLGRNGDVDVVLVHAPKAEQAFVDAGFGVDHRRVMHNDFIIVGPAIDPASVRTSNEIENALLKIARNEALFISRGDESGTHIKELGLWRANGIQPAGAWYREIGQGQGKMLQIASELQAYCLTDRGTWLAYRDRLDLEVLVENDPLLDNPYGIMAINPAKQAHVNYDGARAFIEWITSAQGQNLIKEFTLDGEMLFKPLADGVVE